MKAKKSLVVVSLLIVCLTGCAGARPRIHFDTAKYPVSMSGVVLDSSGRALGPKDLYPVGRFKAYQRGWAILYSNLHTNKVDFSEEVNKQVRVADGEAIVNLEVSTGESKCQCINFGQLFQIFPIHPGCVDVFLDGDIVRSRSSGASSARRKSPSD